MRLGFRVWGFRAQEATFLTCLRIDAGVYLKSAASLCVLPRIPRPGSFATDTNIVNDDMV